MDEAKAREILGIAIYSDDSIHGDDYYKEWNKDNDTIELDGFYTPDELEAIAWWMRNKGDVYKNND